MRIYLDASPIIYLVERIAPFAANVMAKVGVPGAVLVSSDLSLLETLVKPLQTGDAALAQSFEGFFTLQISDCIAFTTPLFRQAAVIRATHNFRTPDALHLAAALAGGCDVFLTNDARLTSFPGLKVEVVA